MKKLLIYIPIIVLVVENIVLVYLMAQNGLINIPGLTPQAPVLTQTQVSQSDDANTASTKSTVEPQFTVAKLVEGLDIPWDIGFLPDGSFIFTERNNKINIYKDGRVSLLASPSDTYVAGEGGMMGLAIDPKFTDNRFVYTCFNSSQGSLGIRVVRWTLAAGADSLGERTDIISGMPSNDSGRHSGCQLEFGPDDNLWVGTGDTASDGNIPQSPTSLGGKVLRVDRDGNPVAGNLAAPFDPRVYSYGHRNVQGLAFLVAPTATGNVGFSIEQGTGADDEVNPLVPGNFGWNPVPGYNEAVNMTDTVKYPDAIRSIWSSGGPTVAASGGGMINGSQWLAWDGTLAVACLKGSRVRIFSLDNNGQVTDQRDILTDLGRLRTLQQGPDGKLYVLSGNGVNSDAIYVLTATQ